MRNILSIVSVSLFVLFSCYTPKKSHDLYYMKDFNVAYANDFVRKIEYLPAIDEISIVDTYASRRFITCDICQESGLSF